jgi:hypothetical protein
VRAVTQAAALRLQTALDRAKAHLGEVVLSRDAAKRDLEADEAADTERLSAELASGGSGRVEPDTGAKRVALADLEAVVELASRAVDKLAGDLAAAQRQLAGAGQAVTVAVCQVLLDEAQRQAEAILADADSLDGKRATLDALGVVITAQ